VRAWWRDGRDFWGLDGTPEAFGEIELRPLPRSQRALGAFRRYVDGAWRLYGPLLGPDGATAEVALGRARAARDESPDGDLAALVSPASDRALVLTPAPRRADPERASEFPRLGGPTPDAPEASASLFDGTTFGRLARVGPCAHAAVLGRSGRFLLACDEGGVTAKIID
jgi:hypothetical protein